LIAARRANADGEVVWSLRPDADVNLAETLPLAMSGKQLRSPGELEGTR